MDLMFGGRNMEKSKAADQKLTAMVTPVVEARRVEPRDDQISRWLHNTTVEGATPDNDAILAHIRLFFTAGATTTSDAMGNLFHALLTPSAKLAAMCRAARAASERGSGAAALEPTGSRPAHAFLGRTKL